ncbi:hypothetical protein BHE74_00030892 [Ensete ventricosum]|nr:hypothetical protein BHE74_00030892 [Ensete ventricosum]
MLVKIGISDSGWDRPSEVSALVSARSSPHLLYPVSASWILHKGLVGVGGVRCDPSNARVSRFLREKRRVVFFLFLRSPVRERESPPLVLPKGDFILTTGEEVIHTLSLTSVAILGMAESYDEAVGAVVWREDMKRHVVLMARRGGVEWRSMRTPLPRMLTSPST